METTSNHTIQNNFDRTASAVKEYSPAEVRDNLCSPQVSVQGFPRWPLWMAGAIAGGVGGATLLALYLIPSAYMLLKQYPRNPNSSPPCPLSPPQSYLRKEI